MGLRKRTKKKRLSIGRQVLKYEKHLKSLIALSSDWYWEQDSSYRFTLFIGEAFKKSGFDPKRMLGKTRWELGATPLRDGGKWDAHKATLQARKPFIDFIYQHTDAQGALRYASINGQPILDKRGQFKGYHGSAKDVTERIQAERRVAIEHTTTRLLAESNNTAEAMTRIIRMICETLGWVCGARWKINQDNTIRCAEHWGVESTRVREFLESSARLSCPTDPVHLIQQTWSKAEPVWIKDVSQEPNFIRTSAATKAGLHSAFAFPIKVGTRLTGVMEFFSSEIHQPDAELLSCVAYVGIQIGQHGERVEAQERLLESEERFRSLTALSSDWYWEQDERFYFTFFSDAFTDKTGRRRNELLGKRRWDFPRPNLTEEDWARHKAQLERHEPFYNFEMCRIGDDGNEYWGSSSGVPIFDAQGRFKGYRGIGRDISTRKKAEQTLRESEARLRSVTALSSDWYWEQDDQFRFTYFEGLSENNSGFDAKSLIGARRWDTPRPNLTEEDWARHKAQLERHESFHDFVMCHIGADGLEKWSSTSGVPIFDAHGCFTGYRGVGKDITTRKKAEQALRESEERFRGLTELSSDWYWEQDENFRLVHREGEALDKSALRAHQDEGKARWELSYIGVTEQQWAEHKAMLAAHKTFRNLVLKRKDGNGVLRYVSLSGRPIFDDKGNFKGYRGIGRDITEQQRREEELLRFRAAVDATADGIHIVDVDTMTLIDVNETACRYLGYTREEFLRLSIDDFAPGYDRNKMTKVYGRLFSGEDKEQRAEIVHRRKDGTLIPIEIHRRGVVIDGRRIAVNVVHDITNRKQAEAVLRESEERFRSLTQLSSDWYWQQDDQFRFVQVSGSVLHNTGLREEEYLGKTPWDPFFRIELSEQEWEAHRALLQARQPFRDFTYRLTLPDGSSTYYATSGQPYYDETGVFKGYRGVGRDITERTVAQKRIQYLATHDNLTGLPNRVMFAEMLGLAIQSARRYQRHFALFFLDLDRFKNINDTFGHEVGDLLLKEMTTRLSDTLRSSDVVARLGGDEFVVLVQEIGDQKHVAAVARKLLSALIKPVVLKGQECRITASIGICMFPADAQDEQSLMKNADIAMYRAKEQGKNNFQFYSEQINVHTLERLALETSLRRALERNELSLHYQAKINLKSGSITGVEALLRWRHPELGMVAPAQFIPLAEETGLIIPIGKWVLKTACAQNVAWQRQGLPRLRMAVNLSPGQFSDDDLLNDIADTLRETGMDAGSLELELTEGMVMQNPERAAKVLGEIRNLGASLAIDDFGVGYSSLAQIKRFPIDTIKIDRSFIRDIPQDPEDNAITEAIIAMGKTLDLTVVAEGVETEEQQKFLRKHGCDEMQGYYFNKPTDADQFAELVRRHISGRWMKSGTGT